MSGLVGSFPYNGAVMVNRVILKRGYGLPRAGRALQSLWARMT